VLTWCGVFDSELAKNARRKRKSLQEPRRVVLGKSDKLALKHEFICALRDFVEISGRGTIREFPCFTGTAQSVADEMQEWFESEACDGFVLAATHMPGAYEDFVRLVVPQLQRRGVFRREFAGTTLRENLGLPRAAPFDWQRTPAA
jgi:alkanesulfonate monooxygenase SsuD/methylene tetrahydromethanopterin reductase-like flavin-dependent oxidoreductase (luciferase family)